MMKHIDYWKYTKKIASSHVNDMMITMLNMCCLMLTLPKEICSAENFELFRKVAKSDYLQNCYRDHTMPHFEAPEMKKLKNQQNGKQMTYSYRNPKALCEE